MRLFRNNLGAVALGAGTVVSCLWAWCVFAQAADPPTKQAEKTPAESQRDGKPASWGARLNVESASVPPNQKTVQSKENAPGDKAADGQSGASQPLVIPLVQGYDSFGLSLPDHDPEGRLRSLFVIGAISRIDDSRVEIRESFLETYALDGSPEFSLELPKAILDRFTRVLVAKTPVTLRKAEFELKGASMEFNTVTKEGGLGGPVQMTIYNGDRQDTPPAAPGRKAPAPPTNKATDIPK
jgi:hypothetical protein